MGKVVIYPIEWLHGSDMAQNMAEAICRALDVIGTPCVLEVLEDLANGRSPYLRDDDPATIRAAIDCLRGVGAITSAPRLSGFVGSDVAITPHGRVLFDRLVEIEEMAARCGVGDDQVQCGVGDHPVLRALG